MTRVAAAILLMLGVAYAGPSLAAAVAPIPTASSTNTSRGGGSGVAIDIEACPVDVPATSPLGAAILATVLALLGAASLVQRRRATNH